MTNISFEAQSYLKRYQQLVLPTVVLIAVVGLTLFVVIPQMAQIWADWGNLQTLKQQVGKLTEKATVLSNLDAGELTVRTRELIADIPADEDLAYFVTGVRSMADQAGVGLTSVELVGVAEVEASVSAVTKKGEQFIPIKIGVIGSLTKLREFLTVMNTSVPLVEMQEFQYGRALGGDSFSGVVTLHFFYSNAPGSIGASDQPLPVISAAEEEAYQKLASYLEPKVTEIQQVQTGQTEFIR